MASLARVRLNPGGISDGGIIDSTSPVLLAAIREAPLPCATPSVTRPTPRGDNTRSFEAQPQP